jgi:CRISPR system Cascade subunit CasA
MLNFHRYDPVQGIPFDTHGVDTPAWERNEETEPQDRFPTGHLDYLTWQSRRLRLMTTCDSDGRKVVSKVANLRGNGFPKGFTRHKNETMMAFAKREKALEESDPWPPIVFREGRVLWRDSLAFFQSLNGKRTRPMTLSWLCELVDAGYVPRTATLPLDIFGIRTSKAKPLFWRQERVPLALSYLEDEALLSALTIALEIAEGAGRALRSASRKLAEGIVAPLHDESIGRPINRDQVSVIENGFGAGRHFWPRLDIPFRKLLVDLAQDRELMAGGGWEYGTRSLPRWAEVVRTMGSEAFREIIEGLDHLGRTSKAVAIAEIGLQRELRGITSRYVDRGKTLEVAHA